MHGNFEDEIQNFVLAAEHFCEWLENPPKDSADHDPYEAIRLISTLYTGALLLPPVDVVQLHNFDRIPTLGPEVLDSIRQRLAEFPFQYYWNIRQVLSMDGAEPELGEIADDLGDIYKDVKEGLLAFQSDLKALAIWHWHQTWAMHWGAHAVSALRALHEHVT